ncbi:hypothetical protein CCACVL1_03809 [Corchorus capsularis]|uniref:Protein FLX-like 4 n=1 Tax=Corchorus capsularis TaxID=210143 RepID=A0A1R3JX25_COCAP|nr:hypothetical protein CCACVL1_03809 [Corchorus capsularis]
MSRQNRSVYEGRSIQDPGLVRHGSLAAAGPPVAHGALESLRSSELLERKIASQAAEIERLAGDNQRLASSHIALREDLVATRQDAQKVKEHIKSIQTESDIQIRVLLEKIAKMEADIRVGDSVKKELQQAHIEAQNLVKVRQELMAQLQQASQELQKTRADVKGLPELLAELEGLKKEHHRLRVTFQYEKDSNIEQVEQMQAMEKNLIGMAREVERLHADVFSAEKRVHAPIGPVPHAGGYMNHDPSYVQHFHGGSAYFDGYGRPVMQMGLGPTEGMLQYGSSANIPAASQAIPAPVWEAPYDPSLAQR